MAACALQPAADRHLRLHACAGDQQLAPASDLMQPSAPAGQHAEAPSLLAMPLESNFSGAVYDPAAVAASLRVRPP